MDQAVGKRAVRPRDAASLVLVRRGPEGAAVLLGQRHAGHAFMPSRYVFPGGRVDPGDARIRPATPLPDHVLACLMRSASPARARALAVAAIRETFEETGLILGRPAPVPAAVPAAWQGFLDRGLAPALDRLDYFCRAVTPPDQRIRFNARFFIAEAEHLTGELRGNGELEFLRWVPIEEALSMPVPRITRNVIEEVKAILGRPLAADPARPIPFWRTRRGQRGRVME